MIKVRAMLAMAIAICGCSTALSGNLGDNIWINGFGHESYLSSEGNNYIVYNSSEGSFKDYVVGLTFTAKMSEKAYVRSQMVSDDDGVRLDWGFGEYRANNNIGLKFGKVRFSDRLYTEVMEVRSLQPFAYLPKSIYGAGIDSYVGFGVDLSAETNLGWGGTLNLFNGYHEEPNGGFRLKDLIGGSLRMTCPLEGLKLAFCYIHAGVDMSSGVGSLGIDDYIWGAQYEAGRVFAEGEYMHLVIGTAADGWYVQGGYRVHPVVRPVVRYCRYEQEEEEGAMAAFSAMTGKSLEQEDIGIGVNLFLTEGVILKVEHHFISGTANLTQDGYSIDMVTGTVVEDMSTKEYGNLYPRDRWSLTAVQMAFMF